MWCRLAQHVIWIAVFQTKLLFASSGGTLKIETVCFFRTVSFQVILCLCGRKQSQCLLDWNEVMKLKWVRVWF